MSIFFQAKLWVSIGLVLGVWVNPVFALEAGNIERGRQKSLSCAACHGDDGNSQSPAFPSLAGQHASYITQQLKAFTENRRSNPMMAPMAQGLSDQDIADIATYYAAQTPKIGVADDDLAVLGETIYRGGVTLTRVPACIACHGPTGRGNGPAGFPALSGQHADYIYAQLRAFKRDERDTDMNGVMREAVKLMTDKEMKAVAEYIQGLYER